MIKVCCALSLGLATPACGIISLSGPSSVAQGKYYASGNKQFDEFFLQLHRLQVRLAEAPDEFAKARSDLAKSANTDLSNADAALADALHARFEKLIPRGIRVKIVLDANATGAATTTPVSLQASGNPSAVDRELFTTVEGALSTLVKLQAEMQTAIPRLSELRLLAGQLDGQVEEAFDLGNARKRREVRQNLADSIKVIGLMEERARAVAAAAGDLSSAVSAKAGTDDGTVGSAPSPASPPLPRAADELPPPKPQRPRSLPAPAPAPKASPAPVASPKPAPATPEPKPPPASAPPPAPDQTEGPKPAEFEP